MRSAWKTMRDGDRYRLGNLLLKGKKQMYGEKSLLHRCASTSQARDLRCSVCNATPPSLPSHPSKCSTPKSPVSLSAWPSCIEEQALGFRRGMQLEPRHVDLLYSFPSRALGGLHFTASYADKWRRTTVVAVSVRSSYATATIIAVEELDLAAAVSDDSIQDSTVVALDGERSEGLTEDRQGSLSHVNDLEEKLRCLRNWGLTEEEFVKLQHHLPSSVRSALLKNSTKKLTEVASFLVQECGVPKQKVASALIGNVFLASSSIEECLRPKIEYLHSLGIGKDQVAKVIHRFPQILTYSMEQRVLPLEQKLLEIGLKLEDIGKVVMRYPGVLGTGINKIDRTIEFLRVAGVMEMAKMIARHPQILSLNLDGKVRDMINFMQLELLLEPAQINKIISIQPSIFTYSVESNLRPKVDFFQTLGLEKVEVGRMVALHPALMGHSVETSIKPKIEYLFNVMNRDVSEIVGFPQFLSYSLGQRIQPRYEFLAERGILTSLSSMLSCSPEVFHCRYSSRLPTPIQSLLASTKCKMKAIPAVAV